MRVETISLLRDPQTRRELQLVDAITESGRIVSGTLVAQDGRTFPIVEGIPRFVNADETESVTSFGDEWNEFNFTDFKANWLNHAVKNTFGTLEAFRGKVIVDAGAGSGAQSRWMSEAGASIVYALELSHSVDGVMRGNVKGLDIEVLRCSIDEPPLKDEMADIVYCHNVIQHTPSVEGTAHALFRLVKPGGELVFNCYLAGFGTGVRGSIRRFLYPKLRRTIPKLPFRGIMAYARVMGALRLVPGLGWALEGSMMAVRGEVPDTGRGWKEWVARAYKQCVLNTFDCYGSHSYQHFKTEAELRALVNSLQPDPAKVLNLEEMFERPFRHGIAFRVFK